MEELCPIHRKLKLDKIKSTNVQHTTRSKFRENIRKYLISSNMLIFDSYAIIKLSMQSTLLIPPWLAIIRICGLIQFRIGAFCHMSSLMPKIINLNLRVLHMLQNFEISLLWTCFCCRNNINH